MHLGRSRADSLNRFEDLPLVSFSVFLDNVIQPPARNGGHALPVSGASLSLWSLCSPSLVASGRFVYSIVEATVLRGKGSSLLNPASSLLFLAISFSSMLLPSCWIFGLEAAKSVVPSLFWSLRHLWDWTEVMDILQKKKSVAIPTIMNSKFQGYFRLKFSWVL